MMSFVLAMALTAAPAPTVVDRVVAVVDGQAITLSELEFEARVQLVRLGGDDAANLVLDGDALRAALELSIAHRLQASEADRLSAFAMEPSVVSEETNRFEQRFLSPQAFDAFLARHEADKTQLGLVLARTLRAERYLDSKLQFRAQVADADVRRYYDTHAEEQKTPFDAIRNTLRERLVRERYAKLADAELKQLLANANVRRIGPMARGEPKP
ncbi:MAG: hypothetical protein ACKVPX_06805 [Myxococcaceae bacterium]